MSIDNEIISGKSNISTLNFHNQIYGVYGDSFEII